MTDPKDREIARLKHKIIGLQNKVASGVEMAARYAAEVDRLRRIIDPHMDADGNFDQQGFDWKCLEWESEVDRLKTALRPFAELQFEYIKRPKPYCEIDIRVDERDIYDAQQAIKESEVNNAG